MAVRVVARIDDFKDKEGRLTMKKHLLWLSIIVTILTGLMASCAKPATKAPTEETNQASNLKGNVIIFHAGSLTVPVAKLTEAFQAEHPHVTFQTEAAGSRTTARKVSELDRQADLVISADYTVIDNLLIPDHADWNIRFARNTMGIAYTDRSYFAKEIDDENWYDVLMRDSVIYGHSDPNADPCGYRTLLVWQLAEMHYDEPGLYDRLDEGCPPENIRPKETDLLALLQSGDMDYVFIYRSVAVQHGLNFIELPDEINLSKEEHADFYAQAATEVSGSEPGETITQKGQPILYGVTMPHNAPNPDLALAFVEFILAPQGQAIMEEQGQPPITPPISDDVGKLPDRLGDTVEPSETVE